MEQQNLGAFDPTRPITPYAGTSGWSGTAASEERARSRDADGKTLSVQSRVHTLVALGGMSGRTIAEIRDRAPDEHHGTLSGALTALHKAGKILRLTEQRDRCSVYVCPQFLHDRQVISPITSRKGINVSTLTAERDSLLAVIASVRELADEWSAPESHRSDAWLRQRDAADQIRAALTPTTTETEDES